MYRTFGYFIVLCCTVMYRVTGNQGIMQIMRKTTLLFLLPLDTGSWPESIHGLNSYCMKLIPQATWFRTESYIHAYHLVMCAALRCITTHSHCTQKKKRQLACPGSTVTRQGSTVTAPPPLPCDPAPPQCTWSLAALGLSEPRRLFFETVSFQEEKSKRLVKTLPKVTFSFYTRVIIVQRDP